MLTPRIEPVDLRKPHPALAPLTYPRFRSLLEGRARDETALGDPVIAFSATQDGAPVGLALGQRKPSGKMRLLSILVTPAYRKRGLASSLLSAFEDASAKSGAAAIYGTFGSRQERAGFIALTKRLGWSAPQLLECRIAGAADWTERTGAHWARALQRLTRAGFQATPWAMIDAADRTEAIALEARQDAATRIPVQKWEPFVDPAISVALRQHGKLVGYILGETRDGQHHYTAGYVAPALQRQGWLIAGLDAVCKQQAQVYGPTSIATFSTSGSNTRMIAFMQRRLMPLAPLLVEQRYRVEKQLTTCGATEKPRVAPV